MEKAVQERMETKSRDSLFYETLINEFEFSPKQAMAVIESAKEVYELHRFDPDQETEKGKVKKQVVSTNAKHGPNLKEIPLVTVTLTHDSGSEDQEVRRKYGSQSLRQCRISRMTEEALDQGGVLTQEDLADILEVDVRTIRRDIRALSENGIRIKTRGAYHDIGPTYSHKVWIVSLYLQYKTYSEIARRTRHSTDSIKRYLKDFGRVSVCYKKDLSVQEISHIAGISERLTREYLELYKNYNTPEYADRLQDIIDKSNPSFPAVPEDKKGGSNQ